MKLIRFVQGGSICQGVLVDETTALDVTDHVDDFDGAFFASGGVARLAEILTTATPPSVEVAGLSLLAPVARTPIIVCIGLNYSDHARESGAEPPTEPIVFLKTAATIVGPTAPVMIPRASNKTDWEVELGVVMGGIARYLDSPDDAGELIAGYVLSDDVSEREFQLERGGQWDKGKSCETFNPLGPWLVTADEISDPQNLRLWCDVNGERMQDGNTADMIFGIHHLIWYLSQFMVLHPGDIINTGTPAGVGLGMKPPRYLAAGDVMTLGIEGLGEQHHICVAAD
ncbi:MAG TPA: fumarylacetoacetate hydrolase family protein [Ilumatobacteraceae bacterium]|nr:fumarylacetoacetate hydrolase family protein [Ilumatobacteraceae bacterium]HRB01916.1 fumarylacetoacetate hydrolase family protein [Ilumatobacteraceae bacterium]